MDSYQTTGPKYYDIQPALYVVPWILTAVSVWASSTRIWIRQKVTGKIDLDDWVMLAAVILQIVYQALITVEVGKGLGKTLSPNFTQPQLNEMVRWSWISDPFAVAVPIIAKLSIAIFLIRAFGVRSWYKWFMIVFTAMLLIIGLLNISIVSLQVVEAVWDVRILAPRGNLIVQQTFRSVLQAYLAVSDLLFALFPVIFVWKLNTNLRTKIQLTIVLALSIIAFGINLFKLIHIIDAIYTTTSALDDFFHISSIITLISGVEHNLVIILGCAPKLHAISKLETGKFSSFESGVRSLLGMGSSSRLNGSSFTNPG